VSNLDNLTAKILSDSKARAKEIVDSAKAAAEKKIAGEIEAANAESEKIIADAKIEAERQANQRVQGQILAVRDANLAAKREMLDKIFGDALKQLNDMPKGEYIKYISDYLAKLELDGEELILPGKYGVTSIDEINEALKAAGKKGNLTLGSDAKHSIESGFMLLKKGMEQNHTFESLIGYYRDDLESEVLQILYA
jgi:V/A-type H+-transporting ATPase subunit E